MSKPFRNDLTGLKYWQLTAIGYVGKSASGHQSVWKFSCDCGQVIDRAAYLVIAGNTKSCGCLAATVKRELHTTHGLSKHPVYSSYRAMVARCTEPKRRMFHRYGGRGISVCERWLGPQGLANFVLDMGDKPTPQHTLERLDNDGNYEPGNCTWATKEEQANNRYTTHKIESGGVALNHSKWDELRGTSINIVGDRVRRGWSPEDAVSKPTAQYKTEITHGGKTMSARAWEIELGFGHGTLAYRIKELRWTVEAALTTPSRKRTPLKRAQTPQ